MLNKKLDDCEKMDFFKGQSDDGPWGIPLAISHIARHSYKGFKDVFHYEEFDIAGYIYVDKLDFSGYQSSGD